MARHPRILVAALGLLVVAPLALAACASTPGSAPSTTPSASPTDGGGDAELEAAWLDEGRGVGIVTYGSSTCVPSAGEPTYADGVLTVEIIDPDGDTPCTRDLVPRASYVALPEGVDPTQDLEIVVTGTYAGDTDLDGDPSLTGVPGEMTEYEPSGGWYDESGFLLLTHGSSGCPPVLLSAEPTTETEVTVTFEDFPDDQVCTADMAPRITVVGIDGSSFADDTPTTALLTGGEFENVSVVLAGRP